MQGCRFCTQLLLQARAAGLRKTPGPLHETRGSVEAQREARGDAVDDLPDLLRRWSRGHAPRGDLTAEATGDELRTLEVQRVDRRPVRTQRPDQASRDDIPEPKHAVAAGSH